MLGLGEEILIDTIPTLPTHHGFLGDIKEIFFFPREEKLMFSSVQFSWSVMSDSLGPKELQHTRPPCPSPTPSWQIEGETLETVAGFIWGLQNHCRW